MPESQRKMHAVVLRPVRSVLVQQFLRAGPAAAAGALMIWGGIYSGNAFPWLLGVAFLALAVVIAGNLLFASMRLEGGVLSSRTLLNRRSVSVAEIAEIVPFDPTFVWKSVFRERPHRLPILDVRTRRGSAGIWLNPEVYGEPAIEGLVEALGKDLHQ